MANGPEPVELVILDCDGVLVDSERLAVAIESRLLTGLGWPLTEAEVVERFVGRSDEEMWREIERALGRAVPERPQLYEDELYAAHRTHLAAVPGIVAALDALEGRGMPTCVASSGTHDKLRLTLGLTGLLGRFEGRIFSALDVARGKPAPDLFLHAARAMGTAPARCLVVEDSRAGVQAARAAGMRSLGYAGSVTPAADLVGPGTVLFDDMEDLPALVAGAGGGRGGRSP